MTESKVLPLLITFSKAEASRENIEALLKGLANHRLAVKFALYCAESVKVDQAKEPKLYEVTNKALTLVKAWLSNPNSVSKAELEKAANAANVAYVRAYAAANATAYATAYAAYAVAYAAAYAANAAAYVAYAANAAAYVAYVANAAAYAAYAANYSGLTLMEAKAYLIDLTIKEYKLEASNFKLLYK